MVTSVWNKPGTIANAFWERGWDFEAPETAPLPVYDMHGHMGTHNAIYFARCDAPEMVQHLKRSGIRRLVFSHHHALWGEFRNAQVRDICSQFPDILRFYVAINPHRPQYIEEDLKRYDEFKPYVVGLKILAGYHKVVVTDKRYEKAMEFAAERKLPILFHTWIGCPFNGLDPMTELCKRYPTVTFFIGHSFSNWQAAKKLADQTENTYFELTSLPGQYGMIEHLVQEVGSKRIIFGTDMPWFDEFQHIGGILSADISDEAKKDILCGNVERLLGKDW